MSQAKLIEFAVIFVQILRDLITYLIIGRVLASWFTMGGAPGRISMFLITATDPIMNFFKKIPHRIGMIDLSPLIALIAIDLIARLIIFLIAYIAA